MRNFWTYITNGTYCVGCSGATVYVYDMEGKELARFRDIPYGYHAMFCPNTNIIAVKSTDSYLGFYNLDTLKLEKKIRVGVNGRKSQESQNGGFCFSQSGKKFINIEYNVSLPSHVVVYDMDSYKEISRYEMDKGTLLNYIEYDSVENSYFVLGRESRPQIWSLFIARFVRGEVVDKRYIPEKQGYFLRDCKGIELSGFTKKSIENAYFLEGREPESIPLAQFYKKTKHFCPEPDLEIEEEEPVKMVKLERKKKKSNNKKIIKWPKYRPVMLQYKEDYDKELEFIKTVAKQYQDRQSELKEYLKKNTANTLYGKGADMFRGYFGPSLVQDLVVGGTHRGKLYDSKKKIKHIETEYYFDKDKRLIGVCQEEIGQVEYILYEGNSSTGICFDLADGELSYVTKCEYDEQGRLTSCLISEYIDLEDTEDTYEKEVYLYEEDTLAAALVFHGTDELTVPDFLLDEFQDIMNELDKMDDSDEDAWWAEPDVYEFEYNSEGRANKYYALDFKTGRREQYGLSCSEYIHVEEMKMNYNGKRL